MKIPYSYLDKQFTEIDPYLDDIRALVKTGDFTLGKPLVEFEKKFSKLMDVPFVIGVNSGTDALVLSMKALGVGPGDEVITVPNTFVGTVGAIVMLGARPVFVDNNDQYLIDVNKIEKAVTEKTKAILPVHLTGCPADMPAILDIAKKHNLFVIEDAAQAVLANINGKPVGNWGDAAGFSMHPLKNLNVWGDAGIVVTRSEELYKKMKLYRNHGLINRDEVEFFGHNCRLDTLQAVIANRIIDEVGTITDKRIEYAGQYDEGFKDIEEVIVPRRDKNIKQVYHIYIIRVKDRDSLLDHLKKNGVEAKIHYPIPLHLQKAAAYLGYKEGDFPVCEEHCRTILTLPLNQHLDPGSIEYVIKTIREYYKK